MVRSRSFKIVLVEIAANLNPTPKDAACVEGIDGLLDVKKH